MWPTAAHAAPGQDAPLPALDLPLHRQIAALIASDGQEDDALGDGHWREVAKLQPDDVVGDAFGAAVAVQGDLAVVGAPGWLIANSANPGAAYIFRRNHCLGWPGCLAPCRRAYHS
jgi:hypothetical protein